MSRSQHLGQLDPDLESVFFVMCWNMHVEYRRRGLRHFKLCPYDDNSVPHIFRIVYKMLVTRRY